MGHNSINDEDFIKAYERNNKYEHRSDKYEKGKDNAGKIKIGYWIFLAIVFILVYYLFSEYYFIPQ